MRTTGKKLSVPLPPLLPVVPRVLVSVLVLATVVTLCLAVAGRADEHAAKLVAATCASFGCYCEADANIGPREPIDAWSSLAPAIAGAILVSVALGRRPAGASTLAAHRLPTALLALAACSIAVFSFHYHATHTWIGEWLDAVSLYLLAGFGIAWAGARAGGLGVKGFAALYAMIATIPAVLAAAVPETRKILFVVLALLAMTVELRARRRKQTSARGLWLVVAMCTLTLAGVAWTLDWTRTVCDPNGWLQLHAVWHLLSAPTILALHAYYASDRS